MIISKTPLRISLVGGGTDMESFFSKHPGACLSFAINKYVYVIVNRKFDNRFRVSYSKTENVETVEQIEHDIIRETLLRENVKNGLEIVTVADIPGTGTGLGSSSALAVGLLNCLESPKENERITPYWLAETAFDIESNYCHKPCGKQDYYASALGGFHMLNFSKTEVRFTPVSSNWDSEKPWSQFDIEENALLLWTGVARPSSDILTQQKENFLSGNTLEIGKELAALAEKTRHDLVIKGDMVDLANNILYGWELKKKLSPWITNEWIDDWFGKAMNNGAWGGKLCGAGGGGFLFFIAPPDTHERIVEATGLRKIDFQIENEGSVIIKRTGWEAYDL